MSRSSCACAGGLIDFETYSSSPSRRSLATGPIPPGCTTGCGACSTTCTVPHCPRIVARSHDSSALDERPGQAREPDLSPSDVGLHPSSTVDSERL